MARHLEDIHGAGAPRLDEPLDLADKRRVQLRIEISDTESAASQSWSAACESIGFIDEALDGESLARDHDRHLHDE